MAKSIDPNVKEPVCVTCGHTESQHDNSGDKACQVHTIDDRPRLGGPTRLYCFCLKWVA